jgi:hypothetical protein
VAARIAAAGGRAGPPFRRAAGAREDLVKFDDTSGHQPARSHAAAERRRMAAVEPAALALDIARQVLGLEFAPLAAQHIAQPALGDFADQRDPRNAELLAGLVLFDQQPVSRHDFSLTSGGGAPRGDNRRPARNRSSDTRPSPSTRQS